ncbi:Photosystem I chlorophyll a apoprotein A2 [Capsicum annuum]|nr:Photosystem I chlorophyll a apoprotein A2 [Capsicum annuum]KAF3673152.1 Photosystem I chlorophyll a apoprotein A2 [Capsicum annuum]
MIIRSLKPEVKILVDRDPVKTSFEEWARAGHFSRTIAKGLDTTTWIWNLHADAQDFNSHTSELDEISQRVFSACFGQLSIIFLGLSGMYFHGARFSNYEAWLSDPTHIGPSALVVWQIVGQEILNGDVGGGFRGIQITSGFFQIWRASGITNELQLYCIAIRTLVFAALMLFAGWFHYHKAVPKLDWFQDVESMLNQHLAVLLGLGSLSWAGHQVTYKTNWGIGNGLKDILEAHKGPFIGQGHKGLYEILTTSWHAQLPLNLAMLGSLTIVVAHHMYVMPPYPYLAIDYGCPQDMFSDTAIQLQPIFAQWIQNAHALAPGVMAPGATANTSLTLGGGDLVVVGGKLDLFPIPLGTANFLSSITINGWLRNFLWAQASQANLFLGFHTLGLYVHNDVMLAFGTLEKQILIEPIFAQWIQSDHGKTSYGFDVLLSSMSGPTFNAGQSIWLLGWLNAVNENSNSLFLTIGPGDFLVHHDIALGLHTTTLILVKGALDARDSKLMPNKKDFGYSFSCDGPGRGGTCDISAWYTFYLAIFWILNNIGWVTFYWRWKHITSWQGNVSQLNESSTYLMGWLRDYLWLNSSQLINGYKPFGMNSLLVWAWMFLFGHLVWATGFMFLISWRGYWQELIETLAWAHERRPLANLIHWRDKPVALSIVQASLVGLAHFSVGYIFTYAAFLIAFTPSKFG